LSHCQPTWDRPLFPHLRRLSDGLESTLTGHCRSRRGTCQLGDPGHSNGHRGYLGKPRAERLDCRDSWHRECGGVTNARRLPRRLAERAPPQSPEIPASAHSGRLESVESRCGAVALGCNRWKAPPCHGAHVDRSFVSALCRSGVTIPEASMLRAGREQRDKPARSHRLGIQSRRRDAERSLSNHQRPPCASGCGRTMNIRRFGFTKQTSQLDRSL
jgi:hypothetical protein